MPIEVVLFDIDDTLVDFTGAARSALVAAVSGVLDADTERLHELWDEINDGQYGRFLSGELTFDAMRDERMRTLLRAYDPSRTFDHRAVERHRNNRIFEHYRVFDDVWECLRGLDARRMRTAVLSNSDGDYQRRKLATVGLARYFEVELFSGDLGGAKPDPEIFRAGARAVGVPVDHCLYVGDRLATDALGALRAGMNAVWLNRHHAPTAERPATGELLFAQLNGLAKLSNLCLPAPLG